MPKTFLERMDNSADIAAPDNAEMLRSKGNLVLNELHHYRSVLEPCILDRLVKVINQVLAHTFQVERNSFLPFQWIGLEPFVNPTYGIVDSESAYNTPIGMSELNASDLRSHLRLSMRVVR
jgi:hypothetical protein